ncbi:hypothetical protein HDV05_003170 [Chytridiales sp. JEL 0842]|nr:hypothetical protein HDV05_003170 [Chytridiales sp. JEL 0842]
MFQALLGTFQTLASPSPTPIKSRFEAFLDHWNRINSYYRTHNHRPNKAKDDAEHVADVSKTNLPHHTSMMIRYLKEEEDERSGRLPPKFDPQTTTTVNDLGMLVSGFIQDLFLEESNEAGTPIWEKDLSNGRRSSLDTLTPSLEFEWGPCLEYVIRNQILETLVEFAERDEPLGMRLLTLKVFSLVLNNLRTAPQLFPHSSFRRPLMRLLHSSMLKTSDQHERPTFASDSHIRKAVAELTLSVAHCMKSNPSIMQLLWVSGDVELLHSVKPSNNRNALAVPKSFKIFEFATDLLSSPPPTCLIAQEAIYTLLSVFKTISKTYEQNFDDEEESRKEKLTLNVVGDLTAYLVHHSGFGDILVSKLFNPQSFPRSFGLTDEVFVYGLKMLKSQTTTFLNMWKFTTRLSALAIPIFTTHLHTTLQKEFLEQVVLKDLCSSEIDLVRISTLTLLDLLHFSVSTKELRETLLSALSQKASMEAMQTRLAYLNTNSEVYTLTCTLMSHVLPTSTHAHINHPPPPSSQKEADTYRKHLQNMFQSVSELSIPNTTPNESEAKALEELPEDFLMYIFEALERIDDLRPFVSSVSLPALPGSSFKILETVDDVGFGKCLKGALKSMRNRTFEEAIALSTLVRKVVEQCSLTDAQLVFEALIEAVTETFSKAHSDFNIHLAMENIKNPSSPSTHLQDEEEDLPPASSILNFFLSLPAPPTTKPPSTQKQEEGDEAYMDELRISVVQLEMLKEGFGVLMARYQKTFSGSFDEGFFRDQKAEEEYEETKGGRGRWKREVRLKVGVTRTVGKGGKVDSGVEVV